MLAISYPDKTQEDISLEDLCKKSRYTVLYFYPKDNTTGCTLEAKDFSELLDEFQSRETQVIGVSKDSVQSHHNFQDKQQLRIPLIADTEGILLEDPRFDVWKQKTMYGRSYMGIERTTFLLDQQAQIIHQRNQVKVTFHAEEVLQYVQNL